MVSLVGYSGHSYEIIETLIKNNFIIKGYLETNEKKQNPFSLKYLGSENQKEFIDSIKNSYFIVAIGDNSKRIERAKYISKNGGLFVNAIHHTSALSKKLILGHGNFIAKNSCVNYNSILQDHIIINTAAVVEHDCKIESGAHIGPGVVLCGGVLVKKGTFVGANSVVKENISIGENVVVGSGSVVISDVPDGSLVFGNPAKSEKKG